MAVSPKIPPLPSRPSLPMNSQTPTLETLQSFTVKGAVGLRSSQVNQQGNINWQQFDRNTYQVRLFGPLGTGAVELNVQPGLASLKTNKSPQPITNPNPQALLARETGWVLPVDSLFYWIRGLANPKLSATKTYDAQGNLLTLNQEGWQVNYMRFITIKGLNLPEQIVMTQQDTRIKLVIKSWVF